MPSYSKVPLNKNSPSPVLRSKAFRRHGLVLSSIVLDLLVITLGIIVNRYNFILNSDTSRGIQATKILPAIGALIGALVVSVNSLAIAYLVTAYSRRIVLWEGLSLRDMNNLHAISVGSLPSTKMSGLFIFGGALILSKAFLPSGIVASLTPTSTNWQVKLNMPLADFSAESGVTPDILCEYFQAQPGHTAELGYGYGTNCPIDSAYGEIYTAGLLTLRGNFPENSTWNDVKYSSTLLGISGAISSFTPQFVRTITSDSQRDIIATDTLDTCVPRMVVDVSCEKFLQPGQYINMTYYPFLNGPAPQGIVEAELCNSTACSDARFAPYFAGGVIIAFWDMDQGSGNTTLSIYSFGSYKDDMTAENIQCQVGAHEELIPVRITGGSTLEPIPSLTCPRRTPASPHFLLSVTRIAEMAFIKMQGIDGKLEPINYVQNEDKVTALQTAIQRMVATGATKMYETVYTNSSLTAKWATQMPLTYMTTRTRLGASSEHTLGFLLSPLILIALIICGWLYVGFRSEENVSFDPLSPVCTSIAGMNREVLSPTVARNSTADQEELHKLPLNLRYVYVTDDRMGFDTSASSLWRLSADDSVTSGTAEKESFIIES